jgi:glycerate kinase
MRVVVAPDKFAGTLSAAEAAEAMATGWRRARPRDELVTVPMADGGEGTLDVVEAATGAQRRSVEVANALGEPVQASWLVLGDGRGLVEAAQACGLSRLDPGRLDPLLATSYGVGQLLAAALAEGCDEVSVGLGGTASVDGGAGAATALGHRLRRADGNALKVGGRFLLELARVEAAPAPEAAVTVATDVANPLLGETGAAPVFGPQKGASPEDVSLLGDALRRWADVVERDVGGGPWRQAHGAGAGGGLGFGLAAFCGVGLGGGAALVAELVGLSDELARADVVLTGEGSLDSQSELGAQSEAGKTPAMVASQARSHGAEVLAVAGRITEGTRTAFDATAALGEEGPERAAELVAERSEWLARHAAGGPPAE